MSKPGVQPNTMLTWFQASATCLASGKRLPTNNEWTLAAMGTNDPPAANNGAGGSCLTSGAANRATSTVGADALCASVWGAEDMVGNIDEWTEAWFAGIGDGSPSYWHKVTWRAAYKGDATPEPAGSAPPRGATGPRAPRLASSTSTCRRALHSART